MRRYLFKNVLNMRDLGGYETEDGACTAFGRIIRSDLPSKITEAEFQKLLDMNVTTVIDLRFADELAANPCAFAGREGFFYHNVSLINFYYKLEQPEEVMSFYFKIADEKVSVKTVLKIIADAPGGVLYHCTAGKDRTGIITALVLSICAVPYNDILTDYQQTYAYLRDYVKRLSQNDQSFPAFLGRSDLEYMDGFFELLNKKYGSVREYLLSAGLTVEDMENIRKKLI